MKPWVTWFVDAGTNAVCGAAVTPGASLRESILAALRAAVTMEAPYGPPGGLPEQVRIDRGKDFLSKTVASVLAGFAVSVGPLPGYTPHLKGSVETVNGASERMFAAACPAIPMRSCRPAAGRWTRTRRRCGSRPSSPSCWRG